MSNVLAAGTRVTVSYAAPGYAPQPTQGVITAKSTDELAHVELLGLQKRVTLGMEWDEVSKNEHRAFTARELGGQVIITEIEPKNSHPINWTSETTREGAWNFAKARGLETVFVGRDGSRKELGRVFDPREFEKAAYSGYVSYGCAMTDGYYAPEKFEHWVKSFRKHPAEELASQNDASKGVKAALPLYLKALASVGL